MKPSVITRSSGAAELARAIDDARNEREEVVVTNCGEYLATHPARGPLRDRASDGMELCARRRAMAL